MYIKILKLFFERPLKGDAPMSGIRKQEYTQFDIPGSNHIKNNSNFEFEKVIKGTGKRIILNWTCQGNTFKKTVTIKKWQPFSTF